MQPEIRDPTANFIDKETKIQKVLLITQMSHRNLLAASLLRLCIETMRGGKSSPDLDLRPTPPVTHLRASVFSSIKWD